MGQSSEETPETLVAACVQFDVHRGDVEANWASAEAGVSEAAEAGARLCVLPEMWSTSFLTDYDEALVAAAQRAEDRLSELSNRHSMVVVGSSVEAGPSGERFNCARIHDCGAELGRYRKLHMFSANAEQRHLRGGELPLVVDTSAGRIGVLIGYDLRFPDLSRYYFHKGVELLVVPAQWPEARSQHWRTLLRARAIENVTFVIGSNRTGHDASLKSEEALSFLGDGRIIDPTGEVLASGSGDAGALVASLDLRTVRTMRRILPIHRDERPSVYRRLWDETLPDMIRQSREGQQPKPSPK